ncbi:Uncharacterised protein [Achromobacter sp. 2789STDY5608633]|nr:Uncharacterised protein [Achromobacter sp. 2789STDY5608633]
MGTSNQQRFPYMFALLLPQSSLRAVAAPSQVKMAGRVKRMALLSLLAGLVSGCATNQVDPKVQSAQKAQQVALSQQLDAALERVNKQPKWTSSMDDKASFASFNSDSVSVSFQGSAADLLKAIAASRGLTFKVTGPTPHIPIFVFVEAEGQLFEEFLRDLDKQFGQRADVVWTDNAFELRYRQ